MITLNTKERGLEHVESWDDIRAIPGFTDQLDPTEYELKEIIGRYIFNDRIACGLTTCRQPHEKGYLVRTKPDSVTNIGNQCGKTHFGVEFLQQTRTFERLITEQNNKETVASFIFRIEEYLATVTTIRSGEKGADWVHKESRPLVEKGKGCPETVVHAVLSMARNRNPAITLSRAATKEEIEDLQAIENRTVQYVDEQIGTLDGLAALFDENDLRRLLVSDIQPQLKTLSELDIDTVTFRDLRYWAKWCAEYDEKMSRAQNVIDQGRKLLTFDNLAQLEHLLDSNETMEFRATFRHLKRDR